MKRLIWIFALLSIVAMTSTLFVACAGNQAGMYSEEGLYSGEEQPDDQVAASSDENEVLRLLGIADEEQPVVTQTTLAAGDDQKILQNEIGRLEREVSTKDKELQNLKLQLEKKDATIQEKEQLLARSRMGETYIAPTGGSFKARYDEGLRLYNSRRYNEAIAVFNQLLASGENNSLVDNCQYWKGECYYGMGNYEQAVLEFQKVFAFPNSNKFDDAQLKLGLCYMQMNNYERAKAEFTKLLREYPSSEYASRAQSYLSRL